MHAAGLARATYGPGDLARKRHELLVRVAGSISAEQRRRCTVVFDANEAPLDRPRRFQFAEITVMFAEKEQEADDLIEVLIRQHSSPRQLTVISSDHRLQTAVRRRRGASIDSDQFLAQLNAASRHPKSAQPPGRSVPASGSELDFWLNEFRDVSPAAINDKLQSESAEDKSNWDIQLEQLQQRLQSPEGLDDWINESDVPQPPPKSN